MNLLCSLAAVGMRAAGLPSALRPGTEAAVAVWLLDDLHGNAHTAWEAQGRPLFPTAEQFAAMRNASELSLAPGFPRKVSGSVRSFAQTSPGLDSTVCVLRPDREHEHCSTHANSFCCPGSYLQLHPRGCTHDSSDPSQDYDARDDDCAVVRVAARLWPMRGQVHCRGGS
jgi:hypothetical protein